MDVVDVVKWCVHCQRDGGLRWWCWVSWDWESVGLGFLTKLIFGPLLILGTQYALHLFSTVTPPSSTISPQTTTYVLQNPLYPFYSIPPSLSHSTHHSCYSLQYPSYTVPTPFSPSLFPTGSSPPAAVAILVLFHPLCHGEVVQHTKWSPRAHITRPLPALLQHVELWGQIEVFGNGQKEEEGEERGGGEEEQEDQPGQGHSFRGTEYSGKGRWSTVHKRN